MSSLLEPTAGTLPCPAVPWPCPGTPLPWPAPAESRLDNCRGWRWDRGVSTLQPENPSRVPVPTPPKPSLYSGCS